MGDSYDAVVVGGGFCGAGVATVLARAGFSCLVLERQEVFLDHTKGEWIAPWGVAEAQRVGLVDDIARARGHTLGRVVGFGFDRRRWLTGAEGPDASSTRSTSARRPAQRPWPRPRR